ncbi:hypothetical protein [Bradyrhizobium archetypum]|uniref:Uncharacterized protein n=1 Tax=Bradyrhizobium archetypum TaxID=2721160 RepID=A0A7Y4M2D9_9BRAD|nr:hypothetical protein [Bradyrhizobium archetypum]NOJ47653.1 hypothetical protein [Bradyrhizobium archetypum]
MLPDSNRPVAARIATLISITHYPRQIHEKFTVSSPARQTDVEIYAFDSSAILNLIIRSRWDMPRRKAPGFVELDHMHCRAICDEIGERLGQILKPEVSALPPRLLALLDELKQMETGNYGQLQHAPSIVPSIDDLSSQQDRPAVRPYEALN